VLGSDHWLPIVRGKGGSDPEEPWGGNGSLAARLPVETFLDVLGRGAACSQGCLESVVHELMGKEGGFTPVLEVSVELGLFLLSS
jgi:hypothetical protein